MKEIDIPKNKKTKKYIDVLLKIKSPLNSLKDMFSNCKNLILFIEFKLNTKNVVDITNMFFGCINLQLVLISNWITSKIKYMSSAFKNCKSLKFIQNIEKWDTSNVEDMKSMFSDAIHYDYYQIYQYGIPQK